MFPDGNLPDKYSETMRPELFKSKRKIVGEAGDIIVFDDAGFDGPENPVKSAGTTIMFGYQKSSDFGDTVRNPAPVLLSDLGHLVAQSYED